MSGEIEDEAFTELVLSADGSKPAKKARLISPVYLLALLIAFGASVGISYMYFSTKGKTVNTVEIPATAVEQSETPARPANRLEREGYTRIGGVEFVGDTVASDTVVLVSDYDPADDTELEEENLTASAVEIKSLDVTSEPEPRMVVIPRGTYVAAGRKVGTPSQPAVRPTEAPSFIPEEVQARRAEEARQAAEIARVEAEAQEKAKREAEAEKKKQEEVRLKKLQQAEAKSKPDAKASAPLKTASAPKAVLAPKAAPTSAKTPAVTSSGVVAIPGKIYSVEFENLSSAKRYSILTNAERAGLKSVQKNVSTGEAYLWRVYKLVPGAAVQIDGRGVEFAADLPSQEEALEYVRKNGIPAAIKQVKIENSVYNVTVCCMERDKALDFAKNNGKGGVIYSLIPVDDKSN